MKVYLKSQESSNTFSRSEFFCIPPQNLKYHRKLRICSVSSIYFRGVMPIPQISEPSGFLMQLSKDQK